MRIIGLTGSIGMGKTTISNLLRGFGIAVHDSDAAVHKLYKSDAVPLVEAAFPGSTGPEGVDRNKLAEQVLGKPEALARLEAIIHPLVAQDRDAFLAAERARRAQCCVLDIPLLFETGQQARVDIILVVSSPYEIQRARVLERKGMTPERFDRIVAMQTPDAEKRRLAHYCVDTRGELASTRAQLLQFLRAIGVGVAE